MKIELEAHERSRDLRELARSALTEYGISGANLTLLNTSKQRAFRVRQAPFVSRADNGSPYRQGTFLLRMYSAADRRPNSIRSELLWLRAIRRDTPIVVPEPVENLHGQIVTRVSSNDDRAFDCVLTRWVEGRFYLRKSGPGPRALRRVGALMAQLHLHGKRFKRPSGFRCPRWDWEGLFGSGSPYYPQVEKEYLSQEDQHLFATVAQKVRRVMSQLGTKSEVFGLIHGDLIQINYLFHRGEVRVIDFGDFGCGHYLYDMGVTLFALFGRDESSRQRQAFLSGYREFRPFPASHEALLDLFIAARGVLLVRLAIGSNDKRFSEIPSSLHREGVDCGSTLDQFVLRELLC